MQWVVYDTYKQAATVRGLLEDDTKWHRCLEDFNSHTMPSRLHELFASVLHENAPVNPAALWDAFKEPMSEDTLRSLRRVSDSASPLALLTPAGMIAQVCFCSDDGIAFCLSHVCFDR